VASAKIASDKTEELRDAMMTMRIKEKAWFNICDRPLHRAHTKLITEEIEDGVIIEDVEDIEVEKVEEKKEKGPTGFHYEMVLERVEFRNSEKIDIKRKINEQNKEKGKKLFQEEKFYEASKAYKFVIHISENLARNNPYSAEDRG
jgi:hypothetical protein